ncbi:MAG TPA: hypothetical protein VF614_10030 [Chthoniobacteraceae bacterium]|jgi:hypothetical protein
MKTVVRFLFLALALSLAACSSFERDWRRTSSSKDAFSGNWDGRWTSAKHRGAGGRLRCILTRVDARQYQARFKANWLAFTSSYLVTLQAEQRGGRLIFRGSHDLGALFGGVYRYEGEATAQRFTARYDSSYDRGTFEMSRALTKPAHIP